MEKSGTQVKQGSSASDVAVSGLFGGLLGGMAMALVLALFSLLNGHGLDYLGYFSTASTVPPLQGLLMHLAVSGIYGMLYSLIVNWTQLKRTKVPAWLAGLVYALLLWVLAVTVLLPAANSVMLSIAWPAFFFGHVAYGLALGWRRGL